jgi:regulatory protein
MSGLQASPLVTAIERIPRKGEYLVRLSDGSELRILKDHLSQFGVEEGDALDPGTVREIRLAYTHTRAREAALRLLRVRPRTEMELRRRFKRNGVDARTADRIVRDLKQEGLVDDRTFARLWIEEKIAKGDCGRMRIENDLISKGIDRESVIEEIDRSFSGAKELEVAKGLALKRLMRGGGGSSSAVRNKVYAYLLRRGFASDVATEALGYALDALGRDGIP